MIKSSSRHVGTLSRREHRSRASNSRVASAAALVLVSSFLLPLAASTSASAAASDDLATVQVGAEMVCSLTTDQTVKCWGNNEYGMVGSPRVLGATGAATVAGVGGTGVLSGITQVDVNRYDGDVHACALSATGAVYCWGDNDDGQLGDNTTTNRRAPVQVLGVGGTGTLADITKIDVNDDSSGFGCALSEGGGVYCWGDNGSGRLGDNTTTDRPAPVQVVGVGGTGTLSGITDIQVAESFVCALGSGGAVYCWGTGWTGQLGDGTTNSSPSPVQVVGVGGTGTLSGITELRIGNDGNWVCGTGAGGAVYCWGSGGSGQLGDGTTNSSSSPVQVVGVGGTGNLTGVTELMLADDESQTCAIATGGTLYCWGQNGSGQLGDGTTSQSATPVQVVGVGGTGTLAGVTYVDASDGATCAVGNDGAVYCWGNNSEGRLGDGTTSSRSAPVAVVGPGGSGTVTEMTQVSVGRDDTTCVVGSGVGYCWGDNDEGQLGRGSISDEEPVSAAVENFAAEEDPNPLGGIATLGEASRGEFHCVVGNGGAVYCWGENTYGSLGNGETARSTAERQQVLGVGGTGFLGGITEVSYSEYSACALDAAGSVYCWGSNDSGQLGDGTTTNSSTPVQVLGVGGTGFLSGIVDVDVMPGATACARDGDGAVYCWGHGGHGELGNGATSDSSTPVEVSGIGGSGTLSGVIDLVGSSHHSCALGVGGTLACWGENAGGQLGDGSTTNRSAPVAVLGVGGSGTLSGIASLTEPVDSNHMCAVTVDGDVYCWGYNYAGQLGDGTTTDRSSPVQVLGVGGTGTLSGIAEVTRDGNGRTCARSSDGDVYCWGQNGYGELGDGTTNSSYSPVQVVGVGGVGVLSDITDLETSSYFSCAVDSEGAVYCWGNGRYGQLGNETMTASATPQQVKGLDGNGTLSGITQLKLPVGDESACALGTGGAVYCWGSSDDGQGGNRWATGTSVPFAVATSAPASPTDVGGTPGNGQIALTWTAPTTTGGLAITGYVITPFIDGIAQTPVATTGTGTSHTVTGLTNGTAYTFVVQAVTSGGTGTGSTPSSALTPMAPPGAPTSVSATADNGEVVLDWTAPSVTGGSPITGYVITPYIDGVAQTPITSSGSDTNYTVLGLTNGIAYTFTVAATNAAGTGTASSASNEVTPIAPPGAVDGIDVINVTTDQASVTWGEPTDTGGLTITSYTLEIRKAGASSWTTLSTSATSPFLLENLEKDQAYEVRVTAVNSEGEGVATTSMFTTLAAMPTPGVTAPVTVVDGEVVEVPVYEQVPTSPVGIASTPTGEGSWTVTPDGGVFTAGDAGFHGSMGGSPLKAPIVGIAATPTGGGYYLVGADGGVFAYGDANFVGSMGGQPLNAPVKSIVPACENNGYFLVAEDGGVFAFGDATFLGSMAGVPLNDGMLGIVPECTGTGYWTFARDGGVFSFGEAGFYGSLANDIPPGGVIGMISTADGRGYWLIGGDRKAYPFGSAVV